MPKYKLRLVGDGEYLHGEYGLIYIGASAEDALDFYIEEGIARAPEIWVHPEILGGRIVYARDVEDGNCHEDAEPGSTTYDLMTADPDTALRPLRPGEVRAWPRGAWQPNWRYGPVDWSVTAYQATVAGVSLGEDFESRDAARAAVQSRCAELIDAWKAEHPEFRRPVPEEPDPDELRARIGAPGNLTAWSES